MQKLIQSSEPHKMAVSIVLSLLKYAHFVAVWVTYYISQQIILLSLTNHTNQQKSQQKCWEKSSQRLVDERSVSSTDLFTKPMKRQHWNHIKQHYCAFSVSTRIFKLQLLIPTS